MLLHHARRAARYNPSGELVPLDQQDRSLWDTAMIAEGVAVLQAALARDRLGQYQAQAAIAALHDDAPAAAETDWPQILEWYDELARLTDSPVVALNRAVAVGQVDGPRAGLRLADVDPARRAGTPWPPTCTSAADRDEAISPIRRRGPAPSFAETPPSAQAGRPAQPDPHRPELVTLSLTSTTLAGPSAEI